jgi:hypothetical protein
MRNLPQDIKPGSKGFIGLIAVVFLLFAATQNISDTFSTILSAILAVMIVLAIVKRERKPKSAVAPKEAADILALATEIENGGLPEVLTPAIFLQQDETAHFQSEAVRYITKNRAVGHTASTGGISVRVMKGVTLRSGGIQGHAVYADVTGAFPGKLVITNKRVVFFAAQQGFEFNIDKLTAISEGDNGKVIFSVRNTTYILHAVLSFDKKGNAKIITGAPQLFNTLLSRCR